jgi:hypothetical protein
VDHCNGYLRPVFIAQFFQHIVNICVVNGLVWTLVFRFCPFKTFCQGGKGYGHPFLGSLVDDLFLLLDFIEFYANHLLLQIQLILVDPKGRGASNSPIQRIAKENECDDKNRPPHNLGPPSATNIF